MVIGADLAFITDRSEWERFWRTMDELGVWEWEARYHEAGGATKTVWSIELSRGDRRLQAFGQDRFPPSFDRFCAAVSKLVGGEKVG